MSTTRDELIEDLKTEIIKAVPENKELEEEDVDDIQTVVDSCIEETASTFDEEDEEEEDVPASKE